MKLPDTQPAPEPEADPVPVASPTDPQTAAELKEYSAVKALANIQKNRVLSDADFARVVKLTYSGSVWGKIKNGTFNGRITKAVWAVKQALSTATNGHPLGADGGIVVFDHVADAVAGVSLARANGDEHKLVIIAGVSGSGKTQTLKYLHYKFGGDCFDADPDWARSYMSCLEGFSKGIGLSGDFNGVRGTQRAILQDLQNRPRLICVDEANYFNKDGLNFIKTITNKTKSALALGMLPNYLRRLNAEHNEETRQMIRRAVAIIPLPLVDSDMVFALQQASFPRVAINGQVGQIVNLANKYHRLDTVVRVFEDVNLDDPGDLIYALERVERAIKVEGIK